ncbi:cupin domain-containing protein [Beijerinckia sp. L45]|uniref:cupin domain-containing protein n=1 Tax=Beijerinckia sp. L45 TaxID=1641855 RepID=UPI00131C041D|nr:cupin domain-containing protein [Beijerinckia sp. L45]
MPILQRWDDVEAVVAGPTVSKKIAPGVGAALVRLEIKAGTSASRHTHPFEQFVQVISGGGILDTEDGSERFSAGSLFHFTPGTWHAAHFDEDTVLVETNLAVGAI